MGLLDQLLSPFVERVKRALGPFGKLFDFLSRFWHGITSLGSNTQNLINLVLAEVNAWRNFRENVAYRTRIISLPAAVAQIAELWDQVVAAWQAIIDLARELRGKFEVGGNPTEEAQQAIEDIRASDFRTIFEKFPKLLKGLEKLLGFIAIVVDAVESIITGVQDLTTIVSAAKAIRENIETGESVFLKQSNKRKRLKLADGGTIKVRVGNLHS